MRKMISTEVLPYIVEDNAGRPLAATAFHCDAEKMALAASFSRIAIRYCDADGRDTILGWYFKGKKIEAT